MSKTITKYTAINNLYLYYPKKSRLFTKFINKFCEQILLTSVLNEVKHINKYLHITLTNTVTSIISIPC